MTAADPKHPKVGDRFVRKPGSAYFVEVRFVDDDGSVTFRYQDRSSWVEDAETFARTFMPAPEPPITEPLTLCEQRNPLYQWAVRTDINPDHPYYTGRSITILPDHTWREGQ